MTCKATQQSDEMFCAHCHLRWDMNDPEPPQCPEKAKLSPIGVARMQRKALLDELVFDKWCTKPGSVGFMECTVVKVPMEKYRSMLDLAIKQLEKDLGR